jgi:ABC-type dipeptide/oligopeptide/nickel transport system ATPase component
MYKGEVVERLTGDNIVCEAAHPYTMELIQSVFCLPDYVHSCCTEKKTRQQFLHCTKRQCLRRNKRDMELANTCTYPDN